MDFDGDAPHWPISSDAELCELWRRLMGRDGFDQRSLWLLFLDAESVTLPVIVPIDDVPHRPDELLAVNLFRIIEAMQEDGVAAFAPLLTRPGPATKTEDDRVWAAELTRLARERGVSMWPVHLATRDRVQVMAADDLIGVGRDAV